MGEKFKDFPCFYYLDSRVNKKNRLQFYSMLAAMFGQTPEEAAQTSELFAHASGKLFGGTGYSTSEIKKDGGTYFDKPYRDCRGFYRRKAYDEAGLKDKCCIICPYSHSYTNNCVDKERQVLHILINHPEWFQIANCSVADFRSHLAISCTNDISEYPVIPFHAYLFEYLLRNDTVTEDAVTAFVRDALTENGQHVPDTVLAPFVSTQLGIISRTVIGGDDTSTLLFAVSSLREDRYTPPQLVQPQSQTSTKEEKKPRQSSNAIEGLARLFSDIDGMHFVSDEKKKTTATPKPLKKVPIKEVPCTNQDTETNMLEMLLSSLSDDDTETGPQISTPEPEFPPGETALTTNLAEEALEEADFAAEGEEDEEPIIAEVAPTVNVPLTQDINVATVKITTLPDNTPAANEGVPETLNQNVAPEDGISPCSICHGTSLDSYSFTEEWQKNLSLHCVACEKAAQSGTTKPFHSVTTNHPPVLSGCAFCSNGQQHNCVYNSTPLSISGEFASIVHDCSDYMSNLSNLVALMDACSEAEYLSIECIRMYGIEGLLIFVSGSFYFIGGGATACAGVKQIFSGSGHQRIHSLNPLLVHVKLLRFGLRLTKIESLAVLYSIFVGTDILLPPGLFFITDSGTDLYRTIMPQYNNLFSRLILTDTEKVRYEKLKRLEWALAGSVDTSFISLGKNRSITGSNALNYRFALLSEERICREGTLYVVTLDKTSELPPYEAILLWEDVAGRLTASSLSCMNYAFLLGIGNGISYFTCFEEEAFFDSLMASARSAYKKAYKKELHLQVVSERYCTLSCVEVVDK